MGGWGQPNIVFFSICKAFMKPNEKYFIRKRQSKKPRGKSQDKIIFSSLRLAFSLNLEVERAFSIFVYFCHWMLSQRSLTDWLIQTDLNYAMVSPAKNYSPFGYFITAFILSVFKGLQLILIRICREYYWQTDWPTEYSMTKLLGCQVLAISCLIKHFQNLQCFSIFCGLLVKAIFGTLAFNVAFSFSFSFRPFWKFSFCCRF